MRTKKAPSAGAAAMAAALSNGALPRRAGHHGKGEPRSREIWRRRGRAAPGNMAAEGRGWDPSCEARSAALTLPHRGEPQGEAARRVLAGCGRRGGARRALVPPSGAAQPGGGEGSVSPQSHGKGFRCCDPSVIHLGGLGKSSWKATSKKINKYGNSLLQYKI